jgi:hypothetical protein
MGLQTVAVSSSIASRTGCDPYPFFESRTLRILHFDGVK